MSETKSIRIIELNEKRFYDIPDFGECPSVTTVTAQLDKPAIKPWAIKMTAEYFKVNILDRLISGELTVEALRSLDMNLLIKEAKAYPDKLKKEAGELGTKVHEAVHRYYRGELDILSADEDIRLPLEAALDWTRQHQVEPLDTEVVVWSADGGGYAGRVDLIAKIKKDDTPGKQLYVIDYKTSVDIYPEHVTQVIAYMGAWEKQTGDIVDGCGIVRLDKATGMPTWYDIDPSLFDPEYKAFVHLVEYWHAHSEAKGLLKDIEKNKKTGAGGKQ